MVNINGPGYPRPPHPRQSWHPERTGVGQAPGDGRYLAPEAVRTVPPATVSGALREVCHINHTCFFLAAFLENGELAFFAGPENVDNQDARRMFNMNIFLQYQRGIPLHALRGSGSRQGEYPGDDLYYDNMHAGLHGRQDRGYEHDEFDHAAAPRPRTRQRRVRATRSLEDDDAATVLGGPRRPAKTTIMIGDSDAVWAFYERRFRLCHQITCRLIAKAFIKLIEPRKQTNYPYTGGNAGAPRWWPSSYGPENRPLTHREPDHIKKDERVYLLAHILRMLTEPNHKQHPDIRQRNLTVSKLEEATMDAASSFFNASEGNMKKKKWLKEAFKLAKMEEKYKRGEIDATTQIFVTADNQEPEDDDDEEEMEYEHSIIKHEEDASDAPDPISRTMSAQSYGSDMTMRDAHSGPTMVPANLAPAQQSFVEGGVSTTVGGPAPLAGSMQEVDSSRRTATTATAIYGSASDFAGSTGPTTLYPAPWQHNTAAQTAAPGMYSYTQPTHPSHVYPTQEQTSSLQSQSYMGLSYDGLPGPHTLYRNNSVGQSPGGPPEGYSSYLSPPGRFPPVNDLRDPKDGPQ
ncbi:hypothetical protein B0T21DRAFT_290847 [Apiosordaria backusii]|uniref:Subtelomeric hrmA-associated cluster protein AFUB-079030/YDR124W-like helical bundle domain-containing protein n=1 Tax=Apiosordaria backusii TaxID=314023 RepID=A0AA40BF78_9PEZI|nr:hypothetical protein B0T21DRAFT_290847 [Apiosordaria backusii]